MNSKDMPPSLSESQARDICASAVIESTQKPEVRSALVVDYVCFRTKVALGILQTNPQLDLVDLGDYLEALDTQMATFLGIGSMKKVGNLELSGVKTEELALVAIQACS